MGSALCVFQKDDEQPSCNAMPCYIIPWFNLCVLNNEKQENMPWNEVTIKRMAHSSTPTETHTGQPNQYKKTFFHTTLSVLVLSCDEPEQQQRQSVKGSHHRLSKGEKKRKLLTCTLPGQQYQAHPKERLPRQSHTACDRNLLHHYERKECQISSVL